jgi:hypothetical protein
VWARGPGDKAPVSLQIKAQGGLTLDNGLLTWQEPNSGMLKCRTPSGKTYMINPLPVGPNFPKNIPLIPGTVGPQTQTWSSGGTIAGSDAMDQAFTSNGCRGNPGIYVPKPDRADILGSLAAFRYPVLYVVENSNAHVVQLINAPTGRLVSRSAAPPGLQPRISPKGVLQWWAAANSQAFAWAADGVLHVADSQFRHTIEPLSKEKLNAFPNGRTSVTAGTHLVVYSTVPTSGKGESVVYDTESHQAFRWHAEAYAAGDWLLWRNGADYNLAKVR